MSFHNFDCCKARQTNGVAPACDGIVDVTQEISLPNLRRVWKGFGTVDLVPSSTALLVVDLQHLTCNSKVGLGARLIERGHEDLAARYFNMVERTVANVVRLVDASREAGIAVIYSRLASATEDGRDVPALMRHHGLWAPRGSLESEFLAELTPKRNDLVVSRTALSFFTPWFGDQLLRNLGVSNVVVAGVLTDGSIASTVRDAGDRGYRTVVVADACAALSQADHKAALEPVDLWYGLVAQTEEVAQAIRQREELSRSPSYG
jgi:nicotinamidase-related amidase